MSVSPHSSSSVLRVLRTGLGSAAVLALLVAALGVGLWLGGQGQPPTPAVAPPSTPTVAAPAEAAPEDVETAAEPPQQAEPEVDIEVPFSGSHPLETLREVVVHYNNGGVTEEGDPVNDFLSGGIRPLDLTDEQIDDLVAFMEALTSPEFVKPAEEPEGE